MKLRISVFMLGLFVLGETVTRLVLVINGLREGLREDHCAVIGHG